MQVNPTRKWFILAVFLFVQICSSPVFAGSFHSTSLQCKFRGQIVDVSGVKFLCQKRKASFSTKTGSRYVLVRIISNRKPTFPKVATPNTQVKRTTTTSTAAQVVSITTTTSTTLPVKYLLISASYEVIDAESIKISWDQIPDVREYRICIDNQCTGADSQKVWTTISSSENSHIVNLPRGQTRLYWVHALLFPSATHFDHLDTRQCCYGTKWAYASRFWATNQ